MQALFATSGLIPSLKALHASVALPIADFSSERAEVVKHLDREGIPVVAWIELAKEDGVYLNADNLSKAEARVSAFENWTTENGLRWAAVGLDIEPNFNELADLRRHFGRLLQTLSRRSMDRQRITVAKLGYSKLIAGLQTRGYIVQTYLMPYIPAERSVGSTVLDRLLGTVDVRGNEEYLMLYTSFARPVGAGMIWSLGRGAQGIAVGSTDGEMPPGDHAGPLDWNEFSRDLIVASHYTNNIGIYDLEGSVRQGFLARLETMNWNQSVLIPASAVHRAELMGHLVRMGLWSASHVVYFLILFLLLIIIWVRLRQQHRRRRAKTSLA